MSEQTRYRKSSCLARYSCSYRLRNETFTSIVKYNVYSEISGSYGGEYEGESLLGCSAV
jgi:hypothetical protein